MRSSKIRFGLGLSMLLLAANTLTASAWERPEINCPDLVAAISLNPPTPAVGSPVDVTVTLTNQGDVASSGFYSYLYVDPTDNPPNLTTPDTANNYIFGVWPGTPYSWTRTNVTFTTAGQHVIYAWVDRDNQVPECPGGGEDNNLVSLIVNIGGGGQCIPDPYEAGTGDDSCQASPLVPADGIVRRHSLCPVGDEDWIRFEGQAGVQYVINADNVEDDADLMLELRNDCQGNPIQNQDPIFGNGARLEASIPVTGIYYARVKHHDNSYGPATGYDLSLRAQCSIDEFEPDSTCNLAREIVTNSGPQRHSFCTPADEDWGFLQATGGVRYRFATQDRETGATPVLALYDSCGGEVFATSSPGGTLEWTATDSRTVYLKSINGQAAQGLQTGYNLVVTSQTSVGDSYEPDNAPTQAKAIGTNGQPQTHTISPSGDQDWLSFQATAGMVYRIETYDLAPSVDTVMCLYSSDGATQIACDDDNGQGAGSRLWWQASGTGRHYLHVRHSSPETGGPEANYKVAVTSGVSQCDQDTFEEDDAANQATLIGINSGGQSHNVCPAGDADWVRFVIPAPGVYSLRTGDLGPDADTVIDLFNVDGQTLLFSNDDHGPGLESEVIWRFVAAGQYYVRVRPFDASSSGRGTEYTLSLTTSNVVPTPVPSLPPSPTPTSTASPTPTPTRTPTPPPDATPTPSWTIHTLIVTSERRLADYYGRSATDALMDKLDQLARHPDVGGMVLSMDSSYAASAAYDRWDAAPADVAKANAVADAIRTLIWSHVNANPQLENVVLVGDDRIIPFRRVRDNLGNYGIFEHNYSDISLQTPLGQALHQDYSLTDDFYVSSQVTGNVYVPDKAVGRLVETPQEILQTINAYLQDNQLAYDRSLVVGYGDYRPAANEIKASLQRAGLPGINSALIGTSWTGGQFRALHLQAQPAYDLNFFLIGGVHWREKAADGTYTEASDVVGASSDLRRTVVSTLLHHGGLNVSPISPHSLDLPEAYSQRAASYVGQTGYSLLLPQGTGLTARLMDTFARELTSSSNSTLGEAWMQAKRRYIEETPSLAEMDRKILRIATLYGLPMWQLPGVPGALGDEFPSVSVSDSGLALGSGFYTSTIHLRLPGSFSSLPQVNTPNGDYFELDGHTIWSPDRPVQPQFYLDLDETILAGLDIPSGILWTRGSYMDVDNFTPLVPQVHVPDMEGFVPQASNTEAAGWDSPIPVQLNSQGDRLVTQFGQYQGEASVQRLYDDLKLELSFRQVEDDVPPQVTYVAAQSLSDQGTRLVKVAASDPSGIESVWLAYTDGSGVWQSRQLTYVPEMDKWLAPVTALRPLIWFIQARDGAGNVATVTNKGQFFELTGLYPIYLPTIIK